MHDLALEVGEIDDVAVGHGDAAHAARGEVEERPGSEAAGADDERARGEEALLRVLAETVEQEVAAVTQPLAVVHGAPFGAPGPISRPRR